MLSKIGRRLGSTLKIRTNKPLSSFKYRPKFTVQVCSQLKSRTLTSITSIPTNFQQLKLSSLPQKTYESVTGSDLRFDLSGKELSLLTKEVLDVCQQVYDGIVAMPESEKNFVSVVKPLADLENFNFTYTNIITFPQYVSTDSEIRKVSSESELKISKFHIEASMNEELYESVKVAINNTDLTKLSEEEQRYCEKIVLDFKRNGLSIAKEKRQELMELMSRISELKINFQTEIAKDNTFVEFEKHELEGLGMNFLDSLESYDKDGKTVYKITMQYPHYVPVMENCSIDATRKKLELTYNTRCLSNLKVLEEVVKLRLKVANLLGYESHSQYILEVKMAKDPKTVFKFLDDMKLKLIELGDKEIQRLLSVKQKLDPTTKQVNSWDLAYLKYQLLKSEYQLDHQKVQEYFPLDHVTDVMFRVFQNILGLKFSLVEDPKPYCVAKGANIQLYKVEDLKSNDTLGYFYLDLFPRPDKFTHAACFPLQSGCELPDKTRQVPIAALVTNFTPSTSTLPSLLTHKELTTYFHEFGHVMHHICSYSQLTRFNGLSVEGDFVEVPSQILENWTWDSQTLKQISKHYRTGEQIDDKTIDILVKSRSVGSALHYLRQLTFGYIDMQIHTEKKLNLSKQFETLKSQLLNVNTQVNLHPMATFAHLTGGYDAGYYGYLWAEVISTDMFKAKFANSDLTSPSPLGIQYRQNVLGVGSSKDAKDTVKHFLGRDPTSENFLKDF